MIIDENAAPIQCRRCGEIASYPSEQGYCCESCNYLLSWSFFKMEKLKCNCEKCKKDLEQEFWKKIPPFELGKDYQNFQI